LAQLKVAAGSFTWDRSNTHVSRLDRLEPALEAARRKRGAKRNIHRIGATVPLKRYANCLSTI